MIVLESNNREESKIGWFAYVPKNRANSENWKLVCEHLDNLENSKEDTMYLPLIAISQISVSNGSNKARSYEAILKLIFKGRYALAKGHVSRLRCSFEVNLYTE